MRSIYLPIRSFGDFIITASIVKDHFKNRVPIVLPDYFSDLFNIIDGQKYFEIHGTIAYNNQPAFFELYKVNDAKNVRRLLSDLKILRTFIEKDNEYLLDYRSRRIGFTGGRFSWPDSRKNIYQAKLDLLQDKALIGTNGHTESRESGFGSYHHILIIPNSRVSAKNLDTGLVTTVKKTFQNAVIKVARFSAESWSLGADVTYSTFKQLIDLINTADLVISAESLPYHLAFYLGIPHYVIYNKSRHFKSSFMTPFMLKNNCYSIFTGINIDEVITDLGRVIQR